MRKRSFAVVAMMLLCTACAGEHSAATESFVLHESSTLQGNTYGSIALTQDDVFYFDELEPENLNYLELFRTSDEDKGVPLCSLPDCTHDTSSCNAVFEHPSDVFCAGDAVYVIAEKQRMNGPMLYRLDADGSERTELGRLAEQTESEARFGYQLLGYTEQELYVRIGGGETDRPARLFQTSYQDDTRLEEVTIPRPEDVSAESEVQIADAQIQGSDLYVAVNWTESGVTTGVLVRMEMATGASEIVWTTEQELTSFAVDGQKVWMLCGTDLITGDMKTGQTTVKQADWCSDRRVRYTGEELLLIPMDMSWIATRADANVGEVWVSDLNGVIQKTVSVVQDDLPEGDVTALGYRDGRLYCRQGEVLTEVEIPEVKNAQ